MSPFSPPPPNFTFESKIGSSLSLALLYLCFQIFHAASVCFPPLSCSQNIKGHLILINYIRRAKGKTFSLSYYFMLIQGTFRCSPFYNSLTFLDKWDNTLQWIQRKSIHQRLEWRIMGKFIFLARCPSLTKMRTWDH